MNATTIYAATGLTCEHCAKAVSEELVEVPAVREVTVDLVAGGTSVIRVTSDQPLDDARVRAAVEQAGYQLVERP